MSFALTDEQIMIQTMAREFSRKVVAITAAERDRTKEFPSENLKKMGELGLMGMMVPFEYEGSGADTVSYVLALSEIAYSWPFQRLLTPALRLPLLCRSTIPSSVKAYTGLEQRIRKRNF
jgi:alkylation response protein AidB-like acyl-CoA dehydrogenase